MRLWFYSGGAGRNGRSVLPKESINEPKRSHLYRDGRNHGNSCSRAQGECRSLAEANPDLDQIRAQLQAHDEAFTNQDLDRVMACFTEKAAV